MSIKYRLVKRKNMSKDAGADEKLVYAQARTSGELTFEMLCKQIAAQSTASFGDVELVIRGMVSVATEALLRGESVSLGWEARVWLRKRNSPPRLSASRDMCSLPEVS